MNKYIVAFTAAIVFGAWTITAQKNQPREELLAVEISRLNADLLPAGAAADGIAGDFVLRNNKVHVLVSGAQPLRRTGFAQGQGIGELLQGVLYDLDIRGEANDQIRSFQPGGFAGETSYVRVLEDGSHGSAAIEAVRTSAKGNGLYVRHEYRLNADWQYVLVDSTYRNESSENRNISPVAVWKNFLWERKIGPIQVADSFDPCLRRAYAFGPGGAAIPAQTVSLGPGEQKQYQTVLAVADSPLSAYGIVAGLANPIGTVSGLITDETGKPVSTGSLLVQVAGEWLPEYPDGNGNVSFSLPAGEYRSRFEDLGRDSVEYSFSVRANQTIKSDLKVSRAASVDIDIRDEQGRPSPARVQFIGLEGTPTPNLGSEYRAHGSDHQYFTHDGRVRQQLPPGKYLLRITRGPEFDLEETQVEITRGRNTTLQIMLKKVVDSSGWIATDFHSHSSASTENFTPVGDRMINFAAEGLEFVPTTEHNRIFDATPFIEKLGLKNILKTVPGIELTQDSADLTAFPLLPDPLEQDSGGPPPNYDPRINALFLRNWATPTLYPRGSRIDTSINFFAKVPYFGGGADRWVHLCHPVVGNVFFDRDADGVPDGGFAGLEEMVDAGEFWSTEILSTHPVYTAANFDASPRFNGWQNRTFAWLQLLNQGRRIWCVAVSDPHKVFGNGAGSWRTYVPSSTDSPGQVNPLEIVRNAKAGRMMISDGPFLEVTTADGFPIGSTVNAEGYIDLKIRVQTANWMDIDRVQVLVNGRQPKEYNFTRATHASMFKSGVLKFDQIVRVHLQRDAHLIVVAIGEHSDLQKGWGRSLYGNMPPIAYTNPIFVDVDHNGFRANGDMLDHPLPVTPPEHKLRGGSAH